MNPPIVVPNKIDEARACLLSIVREPPSSAVCLKTLPFSRFPNADSFADFVREYGFNVRGQAWEYDGDHNLVFRVMIEPWPVTERWEYALEGVQIDPEWRILDIGSGRRPWPKATHLMDVYDDFRYFASSKQHFTKATITETTPFPDKFFDYSTCFHVLEHVNNPVAAAREISRIAKRGTVECPLPWKDGMLMFLEQDHRWMVLPGNGEMLFYPIDGALYEGLYDKEACRVNYDNLIGNRASTGDKAILRNYFQRIDAKLNVIHRWEGELKIRIIQ